jgi:hypothetical protein
MKKVIEVCDDCENTETEDKCEVCGNLTCYDCVRTNHIKFMIDNGGYKYNNDNLKDFIIELNVCKKCAEKYYTVFKASEEKFYSLSNKKKIEVFKAITSILYKLDIIDEL